MSLMYLLFCCQIITESLPISSSSHVLLLQKFLTRHVGHTVALSSIWYELAHAPSILIIITYFFSAWFHILQLLPTQWHILGVTILKIGCIDVITALFYGGMYIFPNARIPAWIGLCITFILLLLFAWLPAASYITFWFGQLSWRHVIILGLVQAIALQPGISRMVATTIAACFLGFAPLAAFELSCLMQLPLLCASVVRSVYELASAGQLFTCITPTLVWITAIATIISYALFCVTAYQITTGTLWYWAWYIPIPLSILYWIG